MTFIDPGEMFVKTFSKIETANDVFAYVDLAWYQTQNLPFNLEDESQVLSLIEYLG
jgi:hypothetical protein